MDRAVSLWVSSMFGAQYFGFPPSFQQVRPVTERCVSMQDDRGRVPADVVPDPVDMPLEMADAAAVAKEIKQILLDAMPLLCDLSQISLPNYDNVPGNVSLQSSGLKLGERVLIAGQKVWYMVMAVAAATNRRVYITHITQLTSQ